ncbi:MAG: sialate O-acetylesterase [Bacteroidetes bacterium]|nr:sialate O-acetylesterase [Bacteroidota bacterium]
MECGATDPQDSFDAQWEICSPSTVPNFSASGYFFGRKLYQELGVVIGLVDISYGGASIHTFMDEKTLEGEEESAVFRGTDKEGWEAYQRRVEAWEKKGRIDKRPYFPPQHFSELCYNAMVHPLVPFASRGGHLVSG